MGKSGLGCAALVVALMLSSHRAAAKEPHSFGERGQLVIDNRFQLSGGKDGDSNVFKETKYVQLNPSAAYFVAPRLSVGLGVPFEYSTRTFRWGFSYETGSLGVAPRVGYVVPLAERLDFYPEVEGRFTRRWLWDGSGFDEHGDQIDVSISLPLLFKPAPHFFIGLGPSLKQSWYHGTSWGDDANILVATGEFERLRLSFGVTSTIGGYFDI